MATRPATKKDDCRQEGAGQEGGGQEAGDRSRRPRPALRSAPAPKQPPRDKGPRLGGHGYDLAGLLLLLLALVTALSVYADLAGPAGRAIAEGAGVVLGYGRWALPFLFAAAGGMLLWWETPQEPARLAIGLSLVSVAGCGLVHLLTDGPGWGAAAADLRSSGGVVGTFAAVPLRSVLAGAGAGAVLLTIIGVAALVLARTTVRTATSQAGGAARRGGQALAALGNRLTELRPPPLPAVPEAGARGRAAGAEEPGRSQGGPGAAARGVGGDHPAAHAHRAAGRAARAAGHRPRPAPASPAPGSCRRSACSSGARPRRSTTPWSRPRAAPWSGPWPPTASTPPWWA